MWVDWKAAERSNGSETKRKAAVQHKKGRGGRKNRDLAKAAVPRIFFSFFSDLAATALQILLLSGRFGRM